MLLGMEITLSEFWVCLQALFPNACQFIVPLVKILTIFSSLQDVETILRETIVSNKIPSL